MANQVQAMAELESALADIRRRAPKSKSNRTRAPTASNYTPGRRHYILYHATSPANAASIEQNGFRISTGGTLGPGVYLSRDINKARGYGAVIFGCIVRVGKVKKIDHLGHPLQTTWQTQGYDSAWIPPSVRLEEDCIKCPSQILKFVRVQG